jgi:hypothetical protein
MKRKKLKLDKDTLLVLESSALRHVAGGIEATPSPTLTQLVGGCGPRTAWCPTHLPCPNMTTTCPPTETL